MEHGANAASTRFFWKQHRGPGREKEAGGDGADGPGEARARRFRGACGGGSCGFCSSCAPAAGSGGGRSSDVLPESSRAGRTRRWRRHRPGRTPSFCPAAPLRPAARRAAPWSTRWVREAADGPGGERRAGCPLWEDGRFLPASGAEMGARGCPWVVCARRVGGSRRPGCPERAAAGGLGHGPEELRARRPLPATGPGERPLGPFPSGARGHGVGLARSPTHRSPC